MNEVLRKVKETLDKFECENSRFVEIDYFADIYSDGYQTDIREETSEVFPVLADLMERLGVGVEVHYFGDVLRVFISDEKNE